LSGVKAIRYEDVEPPAAACPAEALRESFRFPLKLVVVTHVVHYRRAGRIYAYAPYAREMELWGGLFDAMIIAAPCREQEPPGDCAPIEVEKLGVQPQREVGGEGWASKLKSIAMLPVLMWELSQALCLGDAIQVRSPGNLGFLGSLLGPLFSKRLVAKYAGQWISGKNDPLSIRLQRSVLRSRWWRGPVTVYGNWPGQPAHVVPFFNSVLTDDQIARAEEAIKSRGADEFKHVLFVGRLSRSKNVDVLLNALGRLKSEGVAFTATIVGEGPELASLQQLCADLGLRECVQFAGGVSFDHVVELLQRSGILVLASQTEGWPKAIVEAMAFGLVAIGSEVGLIPTILGENRGLLVPPRDVDALTAALRGPLTSPQDYGRMRASAASWARQYSIGALRESLRSLLGKWWDVAADPSDASRTNSKRYVHRGTPSAEKADVRP
jgi:glycosyltransferase involved in cell wall biosynthesis